MNKYKYFFKEKKVTQIGLGLLGRGLNDVIFLLENEVSDLIVTDKKTAEELASSVEKLKGYKNLTLILGEHRMEDFQNRDFILKSAGVPIDSPYIAEAKKNGIPIEMDSSLFAKLLPEGVTTIGVTGTRGKSTVTHLIGHILKKVVWESQTLPKVWMGGNIRDMATLPLLKDVKKEDYVVLELDSWQLQGFGESKISPHVAVFTNFMPDHLNYYGGDLDLYFGDKANIFKYQKEEDVLVVGEVLESNFQFSKSNFQSRKNIARKEIIPKDWAIKIPGEHNLSNIACAIEACRALNISDKQIKVGVESFGGVEGRLQFVKEINGIGIWNDNNATTPSATTAGLEALEGIRAKGQGTSFKNVILIVGGADKNLELDELVQKINETCKAVILLSGTGSEKIKNQKSKIKTEIKEVKSLEEAVVEALNIAESGDSILFSPGFASFGMFKNEYDRNDQFLAIVSRI